ncbi:MAG: DUF192 domain-containing protein [Cyanobacteria bacterium SZAS TMP-1]|nr:DUF192 domain-containing protein [Cyanobacteria bacterium SZAS TMP-1]
MMAKTKMAGACALLTALILSTGGALAMTPKVKLGNETVKLEVAQTKKEIEDGLMYRTSLPETQGMVFLFHPSSKVAFWMYHTLISLDMIFVKDGKIVKICKDVPPCKNKDPQGSDCPVYPDRNLIEVSEVIEVNGGFCDRHGVKEGDEVKFDFQK